MKIERVTLYKYKRFTLLNVNLVIYTPNSNMNIILGGNGAGKSSLLSRLTPIPPNKRDFEDGGYQETVITHNSKEIILRFENGKHSFKLDGEELNNGHTGKIQLLLIKEHLNLTPFLMSLLMGHKKFTSMSIQDRKDIFNMISSISYDYAFGLYKRLKSRERDLSGSLKIANGKLSHLLQDNIDKDTYNTLLSNRDALNRLQNALRVSTPTLNNLEDPVPILEKLLTEYNTINSVELNGKVDLSMIKSAIKENEESIYKLQHKLNNIEDIPSNDLINLNREKDILLSNIEELKEINPFSEPIESIYEFVIDNLDKIKYHVSKYYDNIFEFTQADVDNTNRKYNKISIQLENLIKNKNSLDAEFKLLSENKDKDSIECPSCNNIFKVGYDDNRYSELSSILNSYREKIEGLKKKLDKLDIFINRVKLYNESKTELQTLLISYPSLYSFLISSNTTTQMNRLLVLLKELKDLPGLYVKLDKIEKEIATVKSLDKSSIETNKRHRELIMESINSHQLSIKNLKEQYSIGVKRNNIVDRLNSIIDDMKRVQSGVVPYLLEQINKMKIEKYNNIIDEIDRELLTISDKIRRYEQTSLLTDELRKDIDDMNNRLSVVSKMVSGMSHTNGIIGDSISHFIEVFLFRVNKIIKSVWGYDMSIDFTTDESLTYQFPVKINGEVINKDISETSSGMMEIIDLAFILATLDISDFDTPIYLDEFAKALDPGHRRAVVDLINSIDRQVFLISHYRDLIYPFISGSDDSTVTVLSTDNMDMSDINRYNENIKMK